MAQQPERPANVHAEFVTRIVNDPNNVPDVMRLYGYVGASSEDGHERLYLNADLSQYVEIPANAIAHREVVRREQDPHGAQVLWVRSNAELKYKTTGSAQAAAAYFAGAIQGGSGAAAGGMAAAGTALPTPTIHYTRNFIDCSIYCPTTQYFNCPPHHVTQQSVCYVCLSLIVSVCHVCNITQGGNSACVPCLTPGVPQPGTPVAGGAFAGVAPQMAAAVLPQPGLHPTEYCTFNCTAYCQPSLFLCPPRRSPFCPV